MLLIGRKESVQKAIDLIHGLDVPVAPDTQFHVFRLKFATAMAMQTELQAAYTAISSRGALSPVVNVTADWRTNSLIVQACPRDMAEVANMIEQLDRETNESINELRVFPLQHALSDQLSLVLNSSLLTQGLSPTGTTGTTGALPGGFPGAGGGAPGAAGTTATQQQRSAMLQFFTIDPQGLKKVASGILADVHVSSNSAANALIVMGPAKSIPLMEALIRQLDQPPAMRAEIKVFTIVNADATALLTTIGQMFGVSVGTTTTTSTMPGMTPSAAAQGESSLLPIRVAVDTRTNSILVAGTRADLLVIEAILTRLDSSDIHMWKTNVYRLKYAPAQSVSTAVTQYLVTQLSIEASAGSGLLSPFEQIEREVVVVAEPTSNSVIISATSRFYNEVMRVVEQLDQRPPMVQIECLICQITLNDTDEFGVQLGLQDSVLFNRSVPSTTVRHAGIRVQ